MTFPIKTPAFFINHSGMYIVVRDRMTTDIKLVNLTNGFIYEYEEKFIRQYLEIQRESFVEYDVFKNVLKEVLK